MKSCHAACTSSRHTTICLLLKSIQGQGAKGKRVSGVGVYGGRGWCGTFYSLASIMNACLAIIKCSGIPTSRKAGHRPHTHAHRERKKHTHTCTYTVATRKLSSSLFAGDAIKHFAVQCCSSTAIILQCNMWCQTNPSTR